jgi:type I restriction enzyme S subunit
MINRFSTYKDSGLVSIEEVPSHWKKNRIKYIGFMYGGLTGKSGDDFRMDEDDPSNKPFIPFTNICNNTYIKGSDLKLVSINEDDNQNRVEKDDLFFMMTSETQEDVGKTSVLKDDLGEVYLNTFCKGFRITDRSVNPYFLNYLLNGKPYRELLSVEGNGFTRINLRQDRVNDFILFSPPLPEQEQIVKYLDEKTSQIDQLISITEKKIEGLKEKRTSLINHVVTKGLDSNVEMKDSGVEWIGEIPKHWEVKKLKHSCDIVYGISPPDTTYNDEGIGKELINGPVEYSETDFGYTRSLKWTTHPTKIVPKNSLLFCLRGSTTGRLNLTHKEVSIGRGVCSINSKENQWFLVYTIQILRMFIRDTFKGSTFPSVTKEDVDNYILPVPPVPEQENIVSYIDNKSTQIDTLVSIELLRIETLKEYRQSLISEVVTGKIRVCEEVPEFQEN